MKVAIGWKSQVRVGVPKRDALGFRLLQGFQEGDQLPALGVRELAPGGHAVFLAAVGEEPEELSGSGLFEAVGVQVGARVLLVRFAFGALAVAGGAVLGEDLGAGSGSIGIGGVGIGAGSALRRNSTQPLAVARRSREASSED